MSTNKRNFRNLEDVERELYKTSMLVLSHKISSSEATAYAKICDSWVKTRKMKDTELLLKRVDGLEALYKAGNKKVVM